MNKLFFISTILLISVIASCNFANASSSPFENNSEYCSIISELAGVINEGRYNGVSFADADRLTSHDNQLNTVVNVVYDMGYMHSEEMRSRQTSELKNTVYRICTETL